MTQAKICLWKLLHQLCTTTEWTSRLRINENYLLLLRLYPSFHRFLQIFHWLKLWSGWKRSRFFKIWLGFDSSYLYASICAVGNIWRYGTPFSVPKQYVISIHNRNRILINHGLAYCTNNVRLYTPFHTSLRVHTRLYHKLKAVNGGLSWEHD
jgi:hypothetical protein